MNPARPIRRLHALKSGLDLPQLRLGPNAALIAVLFVGLVIRLLLAPFGGDAYDVAVMRMWADRLASVPLSQFYAAPFLVDHLPGDMWILKFLVTLYRVFSPTPNLGTPSLLVLLKLVPALADAGIAVVLYLIARRFLGRRLSVVVAATFALNPASIFSTSIWGQWDSVSAFFAVLSVYLFLRGNPEWSILSLTYATLIKPTMAALIPLLALAFIIQYILPHIHRRGWDNGRGAAEPLQRSLLRALLSVAASAALALAVLLPFGVGIAPLPVRWTLFERVSYALGAHPYVSDNAFNLWGLVYNPLHAGGAQTDGVVLALGLPARTWGAALFAAAYVAVLFVYWRRRDERAFVWASVMILFCAFMLPTRVHERYLLPALALTSLMPLMSRGRWWVYVAMSATYFVNVSIVYAVANTTVTPLLVLIAAVAMPLGAAVNLSLFVPLMGAAVGVGQLRSERPALPALSLASQSNSPPPPAHDSER